MTLSLRNLALILLLVPLPARAAAPPALEPAPVDFFRALGRLEGVQMAMTILRGEPVGPGRGWFKPSASRYDFRWLASRFDHDHDGAVRWDEFRGPRLLFDRCDRDRDGRLTPADFDWSERSPLVRQAREARALFARADASSDGRLSAEEWQALFQKAARGKTHLTPEDLREMIFPPRPTPSPRPKGPPPGMPSTGQLLGGLLSGELGSVAEGPRLGQPAPPFRLRRQDGRGSISLADYRGKKPVVLVFGSFT